MKNRNGREKVNFVTRITQNEKVKRKGGEAAVKAG